MNDTDSFFSYLLVFLALLALLAATVVVARVDVGRLNLALGLGIAFTKALLIVLFFMHLRHARRLTWVAAAAGLFWLAILFLLTLSDVLTRVWTPAVGG
ncbi:MAG: cytochrome C oxidase subunit IV family protein [Candidatus Promineifilaceae bacterium]|nr:cytochrome C oxidase subunit IV family protein [Candidatus Promineifilaceae bacterium]